MGCVRAKTWIQRLVQAPRLARPSLITSFIGVPIFASLEPLLTTSARGSDETATTKAEPQPASHFYNVVIPWSKAEGDEVVSAIRGSGIFSASTVEFAPLYGVKRLTLTSRVRTPADDFADAIGPNAKVLLFSARSNPRKESLTLSSLVDLGQIQWTKICTEVVCHLARHAGMTPERLHEAALSWLHEVNAGQMTGFGGLVVYLQKESVIVEPHSAAISQSEIKTDKSRH